MEKMSGSIREDVSLEDYSTFKIGGKARYFCVAKTIAEVTSALDFAIEQRLPVFVIGKGSNLLISDRGFGGLVLKLEDTTVEIKEKESGQEVFLGAGAYLTKVVMDLSKQSLGGLEWVAGIPATVGGAVCNNAGAHGQDMNTCLMSVETIEMKTGEGGILERYALRHLEKSECEFSYRDSIFKRSKDFVILGATVRLEKRATEEIQQEIRKHIQARCERQPLEFPNVGSIFKNPALTEVELEKFHLCCDREFIKRETFAQGVIPAGWLIEKLGLKGKKIGGAMVSPKHANFIVNASGATAEEVVILISLIKQKVRDHFGIQLHEEVEYVGF
jgi:UDP-N-acetylmuramate dehydrogenase